VWVYGNSFKNTLVAVVVPGTGLVDWAKKQAIGGGMEELCRYTNGGGRDGGSRVLGGLVHKCVCSSVYVCVRLSHTSMCVACVTRAHAFCFL